MDLNNLIIIKFINILKYINFINIKWILEETMNNKVDI